MFKIIIRHVGITAFGIAIGLLNEWLRNNRTPVLREYAAIIFMTIFFNLYYLPSHWTAKRQFTIIFTIMLISACAVFWYFNPIGWGYWFFAPVMCAMTFAAVLTAQLQFQVQLQTEQQHKKQK
ncbi:hypothetical protein QG044_04970 [Kingella kingae]|uniref:hypothetical protein n=2 Tax=Kingella kingae TaxID=504 RepID=UPI00254D4D34|nr:hypothetical protein [Kingella kingae]MDK4586458.1 hypothetical protein [Kingella kingae]MDK4604507.1 hypothetical protein [Kingella kingae]MDK4614340.1 hypothetical protein [Kingella kingae]MDK4630318.1 hypothetical protein [Kingella kingae]MDK4648548.1 hypothetical protein [Kingella kingae]